MRSSCLFVLSFLVIPAVLLAQHPSGGGHFGGSAGPSTNSGGFSSSSRSGSNVGYGGGGSVSSHSSSSASSSASRGSSSTSGKARDVRGPIASDGSAKGQGSVSGKAVAQPEKRSLVGFLRHPLKKHDAKSTAVADLRQPPCRKKPCPAPCPGGGTRGSNGACPIAAYSCSPGQFGNGYGCSMYWSNDCSALARQLEAQRRQMQGGSDPGQSLIYRMLRDQYEQCARRYGFAPFSSYTFSDAPLFDVP
jgi:hypothetical protein